MLNIGQLVSTVQKNCHVSDAQHAGELTLCTYLLKMREFYRWENDIPLTRQLAKDDVGRWLQEREQMWEHLEASHFDPIPLERGSSDPFDADDINRELVPQGYVYSGGYGRFCKPHFFLGNLVTKETHATALRSTSRRASTHATSKRHRRCCKAARSSCARSRCAATCGKKSRNRAGVARTRPCNAPCPAMDWSTTTYRDVLVSRQTRLQGRRR